jgi:hypothetical protein
VKGDPAALRVAQNPRVKAPGRTPRREPHDRFGRLLALIAALYVVGGLRSTDLTRGLEVLLAFAALAVAVRSTGLAGPQWATVAISLGVATVAAAAVTQLDGDTARGVAYIGMGLALVGTLVSVLRRVLEHEQVTMQTLAGALCGYVLIGFVFAAAYGAIDAFNSGPVLDGAVRREDYTYFSFVTLATLGYGDVVPVTELARRVSVVEAISGQVFLATTIARLVSLFPGRAGRQPVDRPSQPSS